MECETKIDYRWVVLKCIAGCREAGLGNSKNLDSPENMAFTHSVKFLEMTLSPYHDDKFKADVAGLNPDWEFDASKRFEACCKLAARLGLLIPRKELSFSKKGKA